MTMVSLLLLLVTWPIQDVDLRLKALDSEEVQAREDATRWFLARWEDDPVVSAVEAERKRAESEGRAEVAGLCVSILSRVEFRRAVGRDLLGKIGEKGERELYD